MPSPTDTLAFQAIQKLIALVVAGLKSLEHPAPIVEVSERVKMFRFRWRIRNLLRTRGWCDD
jgi:hypothetical protein